MRRLHGLRGGRVSLSAARERAARRWYRVLLRAYPREHRALHGAEMEEAFLALLRRDGERYGRVGRTACWVGAAADALAWGTRLRLAGVRRGTRIMGGGEMLGSFLSDARFALRGLVRRPVFAATAVLTLALGIGANAAVFTVVDGLLFTPLPYHEPHRLVTIWDENPELGWSRTDVSPANAWDWAQRSRTLAELAIYYDDGLNLTGEGAPELIRAVRTTPNLLRLLGRGPALGRDFAPHEMGEGRDGVAILTHAFWARRFGADSTVLRRTLQLDGRPYVVVGILPPDFAFLDERPDVLVPLGVAPAEAERTGHYANTLARLAPGATLDQARAELAEIAAALETEHPEANRGWTVRVVPTKEEMVGDLARRASVVLMGAVGFILLMACVNVANLLLARAGGRARELAVRRALGAGRARVARQLLTESVVLALAGGALGLALGTWGYRSIVAALPPTLPPVFRFGMDASVVAFITAVTAGAALLCGVAPAFRTTVDAAATLRDGGRSGRGVRAGRLGSTLVVVQTAMAVVLLVGGGLLIKSVAGMRSQDFGFDPENVLTLRIAPPEAAYPEPDDLRAFWRAVEDRVGALPGVVAAGTTQSHPLMGSNWGNTIYLEGRDGDGTAQRTVRTTHASPGLFEALRFRVVRGRGFTHRDEADAPLEVVVNQAFVRRYLGEDLDPLQQRILGDPSGEPVIPIVGVIHDVVERSVDRTPEPAWYLPTNHAVARTRSLVVRTERPPLDVLPAVEEAIWSVDPSLPVFQVETLEALVKRRVGSYALIAHLMGAFALLSLALGGVGIYGVTAYAAGQRTAEIGVRMALGAERRHVVRMVVAQGALRAAAGLALGLAAAFGLARLLGTVLVGVSPDDPGTFLAVAAVLGAVSFLGLYLPARRAARVDPVRALAAE